MVALAMINEMHDKLNRIALHSVHGIIIFCGKYSCGDKI